MLVMTDLLLFVRIKFCLRVSRVFDCSLCEAVEKVSRECKAGYRIVEI